MTVNLVIKLIFVIFFPVSLFSAWILVFLVSVFSLCFIIYTRRRRAYDEKLALTIDPDDDIRENIVSYHDEGAGEEDMHAYDITPLRIPIGLPSAVPPFPAKDDPGLNGTGTGRKPVLPPDVAKGLGGRLPRPGVRGKWTRFA